MPEQEIHPFLKFLLNCIHLVEPEAAIIMEIQHIQNSLGTEAINYWSDKIDQTLNNNQLQKLELLVMLYFHYENSNNEYNSEIAQLSTEFLVMIKLEAIDYFESFL